MAIVKSILDTDLYKLTMQSAVLKYKQHIPVLYKFMNRRPEGKFTDDFLKKLQYEINCMADLKLADDETEFLKQRCPYLGDQYLDYLRNYRYDPSEVKTQITNNELIMDIEGHWERTILWEVPLMAIISELYFSTIDTDWEYSKVDQILSFTRKLESLRGVNFADFGTRRRRNYETQDLIVGIGADKKTFFCNSFVGTSNVHLAHKYNTKPIGTMAHEWIMGISTLEGLRHANRHALKIWSKVFNGRLGIALTDTYGTSAFWEDFDEYSARLFDGVRHDSGDPIEFGEQAIEEYQKLGIDPTTKTIVFSDSLNSEKGIELDARFKDRIRVSLGIGTNLTNDYEDSEPLNMVIKLWECNGTPVVKLSDVPTKVMGDQDAIDVAMWTFHKKPINSNNCKPQVKAGVGVLVIKDNKVLTGIRKGSHGEGKRAFPGGHIDPQDQSLNDAVEREILEETGIICKTRTLWTNNGVDLITTFDILSEDGLKKYVTTYVVADYVSGGNTLEDGSVEPLEPHKCDKWEWHTLDEIKAMSLNQIWIPIDRILEHRGRIEL